MAARVGDPSSSRCVGVTSATHGHVGKHWLMQKDKLFVIAADTLIGYIIFY